MAPKEILAKSLTQGVPSLRDGAAMDRPADRWPSAIEVPRWTDKYFSRTAEVVRRFGDSQVTYAVFMRRPVLFAARLATDWLRMVCAERGTEVVIEAFYKEADWVGAGEPMLHLTGSLIDLSELETLFLQKLGACCVAAYNAYHMCMDLPRVAFLAMDARHCAGTEMAELMAYAAAVGGERAQIKADAKGFIGNATDATAHYFGQAEGKGTMPHSLIGYAGSTVRAAEMFHETHPDVELVVLVDYFGQEITDALEVCRRFPDLAAEGRLGVRLDTHGGRFIEGLDTQTSYEVLERNASDAIRGYRSEPELRNLIGTGVSAAAIWHMREELDLAGYPKVRIVASSGFSPAKCRVMAYANTPIDVIGTGSFLPDNWNETYATADIIAYDGLPRVKVGREFLLKKREVPARERG
ncbi:nicotinate phosphoribosyltransferase [Rhodospirillum rubrum]|nr:nicotinate phosphoribosyltransferase [Rhodospirillum rubrum]MBK1675448.1 nicotinate phosphoribosyltransferase [Rhodospirillum rubrum]